MRNSLFCAITQLVLVISYRRFGTNYRVRPEGSRTQPVIFRLEYRLKYFTPPPLQLWAAFMLVLLSVLLEGTVELFNDFLKVKKPEISSLLHISLPTDTLHEPSKFSSHPSYFFKKNYIIIICSHLCSGLPSTVFFRSSEGWLQKPKNCAG
jgi:hypothetical protein